MRGWGFSLAMDERATRSAGAATREVDRLRDRGRTEHALRRAVEVILGREGFEKLGVNAVAREAGVDKVLIYRYFGGLDGLLSSWATEATFWPSVEELTGYQGEALLRRDPPRRVCVVFQQFARALKRRPATQEVIAWELRRGAELPAALREVRTAVIEQLLRLYLPELKPVADGGVRAAESAAVFGALQTIWSGVLMQVLRSKSAGEGGGRINALESDADWAAMDGAIELMVSSLFAQVAGGGGGAGGGGVGGGGGGAGGVGAP